MVTKNSLVSIILATYNRGHLIEEVLDSIASQSYSNWECIIVDDGSVDNTKQVLQPILQSDTRFKYFKRNSTYKKGLPGSRNMGLELAKGDAIIFFDDDDIVHPDNLKINLEILAFHEADFCRYDKKPFVGAWNAEIIKDGDFSTRPVGIQEIEKMIKGELPFASCTVMWDKKCFLNEKFNENLQYAEEWELYSRLLSLGFKGVSIDKVLYYNRKHQNSNTGEFWNNDPARRLSKVDAVKLVIDNLKVKNLLTASLVHYFIRYGFFLKEPEIIDYILQKSNSGIFTRLKYKWGYKFYPMIRPLFLLKKKLKKKNS